MSQTNDKCNSEMKLPVENSVGRKPPIPLSPKQMTNIPIGTEPRYTPFSSAKELIRRHNKCRLSIAKIIWKIPLLSRSVDSSGEDAD